MHIRHLTIACLFAMGAVPALAQSNVGDLLDKGAKKLTKDDYMSLAPFRLKYVWPQGGGEGDLVYVADGTLSGSEYHYSSRSESPATGTWSADDAGKWCMKKHMPVWNSRTDMCWYTWKLGEDYWGSATDSDRSGRVVKIRSFGKQP